jgi:hypothetical protein
MTEQKSVAKTIYQGDLQIGDHEYPIQMWSETTKLDKPNLWNGDDHKYIINFKFSCADKDTKDFHIRVLRDLIKHKRDD